MPCRIVVGCHHFIGSSCLHLHGEVTVAGKTKAWSARRERGFWQPVLLVVEGGEGCLISPLITGIDHIRQSRLIDATVREGMGAKLGLSFWGMNID